jgi:RimJ/RimL family protein N-acetyltransferase
VTIDDAHGSPTFAECDDAEPVGRFHAWWRGDPLPVLLPWPALAIQRSDQQEISAPAGIAPIEARQRMQRGHQPWLARIAAEPVGWGWCASVEAAIGELGITRPLPSGNRYLWDFVTVPAWRGRGVYPRLLQAIVAAEPDAERFWMGHDLGNDASARGIARAGFQEVGLLYRLPAGGYSLVPSGPRQRAAAAADFFGVGLAH